MPYKKKTFIRDLTENNEVEDLFLVRSKNNGITKAGKPYIALTLGDATGEVKGRIWDNAEKLGERFHDGDIVRVKGFSVLYQGALQLNISDIDCCTDVDAADFLPASTNDPEATYAAILLLIEGVQNSHLKTLLQNIFGNDAVAHAFKRAPAAKTLHHDYLGGLMEHTHMVARIAKDMVGYYPTLNQDLVIAGALLHDIGKIRELSCETSFEYSDSGRLLGHIVMGDEIVREAIEKIDGFPSELAMVLRHIVLSHHGQYEFGSPKRPKTLEAVLISYIDDLDAKMYGFTRAVTKEKSTRTGWTTYNKLFDRYLYAGTPSVSPEHENE
ncbi:MAG: HD domain-containing protein [Desulfobacterota bacterium]|nr:HD domain-containing protein [Thermodesulfobacteriota bacterium]